MGAHSDFGRHCWHLGCDRNSQMAAKLISGEVTLEDFVYWPRVSDVIYSFTGVPGLN